MWTCTLCTFINEEGQGRCRMCEQDRPAVARSAASASNLSSSSSPSSGPRAAAPLEIVELSSDDDERAEGQQQEGRQPGAQPVQPKPQAAGGRQVSPIQRKPSPSTSAAVVAALSAAAAIQTARPARPSPAATTSAGVAAASSAAAVASPVPFSSSSPPPSSAAASSSSSSSTSRSSKAEQRAQAAAARAQAQAARAQAKLQSRAEKDLEKLLARAHRGAFAEQELRVGMRDEWKHAPYSRLVKSLNDNKFQVCFTSASSSSSAAAAASSSSSAAASRVAAASSSPCSPTTRLLLHRLPLSLLWERRQPPEVVSVIRSRKRLKIGHGAEEEGSGGINMSPAPMECWEAMEKDGRANHPPAAASDGDGWGERRVEELPPPQPVPVVVSLMDGEEFLRLHGEDQLFASLHSWIRACDEHDQQLSSGSASPQQKPRSVLLVVHGVYRLVQMRANQAMQQRRAQGAEGAAAPSASSAAGSKVKPLKKLTEVDALLAQIWFQTKGRVRFKMFDDLTECLGWLLLVTTVLSKSPYKEVDNVLTLVNTERTNRMRGGDDFRIRGSPGSDEDDDEDGSSSSLQQRRKQARSTLAESWRLFLMQIPRLSERIALCLTKHYPTLRCLWDAYRVCATDKQREVLLQDLVVTPAPTPSARAVRIGPALSKAVYQAIWIKQAADTQSTLQQDEMEE